MARSDSLAPIALCHQTPSTTRAMPARSPSPYGGGLRRDPHRHRLITLHEAGIDALGLARQFDLREALQDLLPDHPQLHLGQAVADAAVDAEAEGEVLAGPGAVDDVRVGGVDLVLLAVAPDGPHDHLFPRPYLLSPGIEVFPRPGPHMRPRGLPAGGLRHH